MRVFVALILIIYLIGVGVVLSPTIKEKWNTATASDLTASVIRELPYAFAWPVRVYYSLTGHTPSPSPSPSP